MSDSVRPQRRQPTRLPHPWDSPGKNTGVGCHLLLQCMKEKSEMKSFSRVLLFETPWTAAYQAPPSMGFSKQEYWSGLPLPSPKDTERKAKRAVMRRRGRADRRCPRLERVRGEQVFPGGDCVKNHLPTQEQKEHGVAWLCGLGPDRERPAGHPEPVLILLGPATEGPPAAGTLQDPRPPHPSFPPPR